MTSSSGDSISDDQLNDGLPILSNDGADEDRFDSQTIVQEEESSDTVNRSSDRITYRKSKGVQMVVGQHLYSSKVGIYVDVSNLAMNGGMGMRYEILRKFGCRGGAEPVRLNAYVSFDPERAERDINYKRGQDRFHSVLRDFGFKVIQKNVKWYIDEAGNRVGKANADLDLAVDALLQSKNLDRILICTGDGDFTQVVRSLQNRGCRVEILAFKNVSSDLRKEADLYISGYLIPEMLPFSKQKSELRWGEIDSLVRGVCYAFDATRGWGWIRYLKNIDGELWRTDTRDINSPYERIFFHSSQIPDGILSEELPMRNLIFEFRIEEEPEKSRLRAVDLRAIRSLT